MPLFNAIDIQKNLYQQQWRSSDDSESVGQPAMLDSNSFLDEEQYVLNTDRCGHSWRNTSPNMIKNV